MGYWLAMGALTYGFTQLGPNPLDEAVARPAAPAAIPAPAEPQTEVEMAAAPPTPAAEPSMPVAETEPPVDVEAPAPAAGDREVERSGTEPTERRADARTSEANSERAKVQPPPIRTAEPAPAAFSFPEFTDSSRPARRERASDGPRIDSLFERAEDRPSKDTPEPSAPPAADPDTPVAVTSCEAAIARNNEQLTIGGARGPADITREAYAGILQNGRYLSACSIPDRTVFEICAAVKDGRAVGITVVSSPPNSALNACVRNAVGRLKFPQNARLDVTHTRFDAVKR